jgi:hypothetical protein
MQEDALRQEYSSMSDDDPVALQSDQGALTDEAELLLAEEFTAQKSRGEAIRQKLPRGRIAVKLTEEPFHIIILESGSLCPACEFYS